MKTAHDILRRSVLPRHLDRRVSALRSLNTLAAFAQKYDLQRLWPELPYLEFLRRGRERSEIVREAVATKTPAVYATHAHFETKIMMSPTLTTLIRETSGLPVREIRVQQDRLLSETVEVPRLNVLIRQIFRERKRKYAVPVSSGELKRPASLSPDVTNVQSESISKEETVADDFSREIGHPRRRGAPAEQATKAASDFANTPESWKDLAREMMLRGGDVTETIRDFAAKHETGQPGLEPGAERSPHRKGKPAADWEAPALRLPARREPIGRAASEAKSEGRPEIKEAVPVGGAGFAEPAQSAVQERTLHPEAIERSVRQALRNLPQSEVNVFADRVSRSIENRVRVERDWRGDL